MTTSNTSSNQPIHFFRPWTVNIMSTQPSLYMSNMAHILDCANVMCFDDNSKSFEEAVKSADEPEEIIALFNQVTLRKL